MLAASTDSLFVETSRGSASGSTSQTHVVLPSAPVTVSQLLSQNRPAAFHDAQPSAVIGHQTSTMPGAPSHARSIVVSLSGHAKLTFPMKPHWHVRLVPAGTSGAPPAPPPMTAEEALRQAEAEGLTLLKADNTAGYKNVFFDRRTLTKPYQAKVA